MKTSVARGFTLIELVVVITILGILAAFAVPRFISLETQARVATINSLSGSVKSAASLARAMSMATANNANVLMEGNNVTLTNNYPDAGATGIANALSTISAADFTFTAGSPVASGTAKWDKVGAGTPATCEVTYTPPTAAGGSPAIAVITTGC